MADPERLEELAAAVPDFEGLAPGLGGLATRRLAVAGEGVAGQGTVAVQSGLASATVPGLILIGVLALRVAVILSAQCAHAWARGRAGMVRSAPAVPAGVAQW